MTVKEVLSNYNLEAFGKTYYNQFGNPCNVSCENLGEFFNSKVKSIDIHFPTNSVTITIIEEGK